MPIHLRRNLDPNVAFLDDQRWPNVGAHSFDPRKPQLKTVEPWWQRGCSRLQNWEPDYWDMSPQQKVPSKNRTESYGFFKWFQIGWIGPSGSWSSDVKNAVKMSCSLVAWWGIRYKTRHIFRIWYIIFPSVIVVIPFPSTTGKGDNPTLYNSLG